ncbi:MAG: DUF4374 domain-containing protein [Bacteroidales bacterium]|nr:DUF4374 domain-containing protein [Bacteroidales bacterium]
MKKKNLFAFLMACVFISVFTACDDDDELGGGNDGNGDDKIEVEQYVIAAASKEAVYLLQTDNLDTDNLTIEGAGIEAESSTAWVFHSNKYAYRLMYNQGSAGTGSSYELNDQGKLKERDILFEIRNRFTTYGPFGKYIITAASGATDNFDAEDTGREYPKYGVTFTYLDVEAQTLATKTVVTENMVDDNGEYYTVSGIVDVNGKLFTALCPQGYSKYGIWKGHEDIETGFITEDGVISATLHPNKVWVAIYNGTDFENPKIIKDDRISFATSRYRSQFYQTIVPDATGNVYVFSASNARTYEGAQKTDKPSGVVRINAGTEEFDQDYYCNIEEVSGGYPLFKVWHISEDYYLLQMYAQQDYESTSNADTRRLAIFKAATKDFQWVDAGLPSKGVITSFGSSPYFENGRAYMPVVTTDGAQPTIYIIDPATATATRGITITSNSISAIGKLRNY